MEDYFKNIIKEEVDKFLLKEYSSVAPYKENLLRMIKEMSQYFEEIKADIIRRKEMGDPRASLHETTFLSIDRDIKQLSNDINNIV